MGDHEACLSSHQASDRLLYLTLRVGVHVAGRLVEDEHVGVIEHGAGDGSFAFCVQKLDINILTKYNYTHNK